MHRKSALARGTPFLLTFAEWLFIWQDSGHLWERGHHRGEYVMARFGDKGPYAVGNVEIIPAEQNISDGNTRKIFSSETRAKMSASAKRSWARRKMPHAAP
jgi:hypothetical protein